MSSDHQAAGFANFGGEARKHPVARRVSPVDPRVRWQANGEPVAVPGGDLLARNYQQRSGATCGPHPISGVGVVVGRDDEVQPAGVRGRHKFIGVALAVGVNRVQMQVPAVPTRTPGRRRRICDRGAAYSFFQGGLPTFQDDARLPRHPPWAEDHRTEGHDPHTRLDGACKIARRGMASRDHKAVAGSAGPASESCRITQVVAVRTKNTQIQHISDRPAHREVVTRGADSDSLHARRHLERQVRPLVDPKSKPP